MMMRRASSISRGDVASTSALAIPAPVPPASRPRPNATAASTRPPIAIGSRSLRSEIPNSRYAPATSQYDSTGLL